MLVREDRLFSRVYAGEDAGSGGQTPRAAAGYEASSRCRGPEQWSTQTKHIATATLCFGARTLKHHVILPPPTYAAPPPICASSYNYAHHLLLLSSWCNNVAMYTVLHNIDFLKGKIIYYREAICIDSLNFTLLNLSEKLNRIDSITLSKQSLCNSIRTTSRTLIFLCAWHHMSNSGTLHPRIWYGWCAPVCVWIFLEQHDGVLSSTV